jgi:hypothetical protein
MPEFNVTPSVFRSVQGGPPFAFRYFEIDEHQIAGPQALTWGMYELEQTGADTATKGVQIGGGVLAAVYNDFALPRSPTAGSYRNWSRGPVPGVTMGLVGTDPNGLTSGSAVWYVSPYDEKSTEPGAPNPAVWVMDGATTFGPLVLPFFGAVVLLGPCIMDGWMYFVAAFQPPGEVQVWRCTTKLTATTGSTTTGATLVNSHTGGVPSLPPGSGSGRSGIDCPLITPDFLAVLINNGSTASSTFPIDAVVLSLTGGPTAVLPVTGATSFLTAINRSFQNPGFWLPDAEVGSWADRGFATEYQIDDITGVTATPAAAAGNPIVGREDTMVSFVAPVLTVRDRLTGDTISTLTTPSLPEPDTYGLIVPVNWDLL